MFSETNTIQGTASYLRKLLLTIFFCNVFFNLQMMGKRQSFILNSND
jgi:hypothetical protein